MITLEGNLNIVEMNAEKEYIEVIDGETLFKGKLYECSCETECGDYGYVIKRHQKIVLYDYTAEKLKNGYIEKKTIKKALEKIYKDNSYVLCDDMDIDENVDVIYDELRKKDLIK